MDQGAKQVTGIAGLISKSPLGVGVSSMVYSKSLNENEMDELRNILDEKGVAGMCNSDFSVP